MSEPFKLHFAPAQYGGVSQAVFHDLDGYQCRLRGCDSESLTLGLVGPRDFGTMRLDRERSREIALALLGFAVSGKLGAEGKAALQNLRAAFERVELTDAVLQSNLQYAQGFANLTEQLQGSLAAGVKLERENEQLRELLRQSRYLYGRNGKESVQIFEAWRKRVEAALAPAAADLLSATAEEDYQVCSKCGRKTWAQSEFNNICGMTQPDGGKCAGRFQ